MRAEKALQAEASALLSRLYENAGYGTGHSVNHDPYRIPFVVQIDGETVGTLTLAIDSPAGLAIDATFPLEVAALRQIPGARLCELTKLAFDAAESRPLLAALFGAILQYGSEHYKSTHVLIEVNPIHRRFYERMLGFEAFAGERMNDRVRAPAVAMKIEVTEILRRAAERAGHSLYAQFSPDTGILNLSDAAPSASRDTRR